jgi:hypothetical protein
MSNYDASKLDRSCVQCAVCEKSITGGKWFARVQLVKCAVCDQIIAGGKWSARIQHERMNIMVALCCPLCTQAFEGNPDAYMRRIEKLPDDDRRNSPLND